MTRLQRRRLHVHPDTDHAAGPDSTLLRRLLPEAEDRLSEVAPRGSARPRDPVRVTAIDRDATDPAYLDARHGVA